MRRHVLDISLIVVVMILIAANVMVYLLTQPPSFRIEEKDVECIEYRRYQQNKSDWAGIPTTWRDEYRRIEDREDIALICDVLSTMFLREYPMDAPEEAWRDWTTYQTFDSCYVFYMKDGTTRIFNGPLGHLVYFDGHWCYATAGEKYGYWPLWRLLMDASYNGVMVKP